MSVTGVQNGETATAVPWPPLPSALRDKAVGDGDLSYDRVRSNYVRAGSPRLVIMADTEAVVAAAIRYAASVREATGTRVPLSFRSGGHGFTTSSVNDGGLILDVSGLNRIDVADPETGMVRVQAGALWGDVAAALAPYDLTITSGNFGDVGVGGLTVFGGVGYFARKHGLTIDRVRAARLVTADGTVHVVDSEHEPELFWAVRGGGSQLGIVTEFWFEAVPIGSAAGDASIINQTAQYLTTDLPGFVASWGDWIREAPREMTSFLMFQRAADHRTVIQATNVWAGTDTTEATPVFEAAAHLAPLLGHDTAAVPYAQFLPTPRQPHRGQQHIRLRDALVRRADRELGQAVEQSLAHRTTGLAELRSLGAAVADIRTEATAWTDRGAEVLAATWVHQHGTEATDESFAPIRKLATGAYGGYTSDTSPAAAALAWPGRTGHELSRIAERVDPDHLFDQGLHLPRKHQ